MRAYIWALRTPRTSAWQLEEEGASGELEVGDTLAVESELADLDAAIGFVHMLLMTRNELSCRRRPRVASTVGAANLGDGDEGPPATVEGIGVGARVHRGVHLRGDVEFALEVGYVEGVVYEWP